MGGWNVGGCIPGICMAIGCPPPWGADCCDPPPPKFAGREIIRVYSLCPGGSDGAGGGAIGCIGGGALKAPVAPPIGDPKEGDGDGDGDGDGFGAEGEGGSPAPGPNMLVNSPGGFPAGVGADGVGACGNPDADGNCCGRPPGGSGRKARVNSPSAPCGSGRLGVLEPAWPELNICVKAPGSDRGGVGGGQSPSGRFDGKDELNILVNSLCPWSAGCCGGGACGADWPDCPDPWNSRVNSPGGLADDPDG